MTISKIPNSNYNLQTWVGDSGSIRFSGFPTDDDYTFYCEIHGKTDIVKEIALNREPSVIVDISVEDTEALGQGRWPYGVKICKGEIENTLIPDIIQNQAFFIVNKKLVEGTENE